MPEPGRLVVPLLLNEREILGHVVESLQDRRERNLIVPSEFSRLRGSGHGWLRRSPPLESVDP